MEKKSNNLEREKSNLEKGDDFKSEIKGFKLEEQLVEQAIQHAECAIEQEKNPETKRKMSERLGRFARRIVGITSIAALSLTLNHVRTHNNEIEEISDGERTEYIHSDEETNEVLMHLSGKEDLSYEDKKYLLTERIKNYSPAAEKYDLDAMSLEEIVVVLINENGNNSIDEKTAGELIDKMFVKPEPISEEQYETMIDILKDAGNPKIAWNLGDSVDRPHYNPLTHTIYISPVFFGDNISILDGNFIAELAHSKQFSDKPVESYLKVIKSGFNMLGKFMVRGGKDSFKDIQKEEYHEEGSLEHEAHSEIEIELKEKFKDSVNSDSLE